MIVYLSDGAATCDVIVPGLYQGNLVGSAEALDLALDCACAADYFYREHGGEYKRRVRRLDETLTIVFDGHPISHTVRDWCLIYDGMVDCPRIIGQSEY